MDSKRNVNIDVIRIVALFTVFIVHAFLNNGYYEVPMEGWYMYLATYVRQLAMICVPLFIVITGYLQSGREIRINKKYICKLAKVLMPYLIVTVLSYIVMLYYDILGERTLFTMLFGFADNGYTWYIEMYLGLFLLFPFLNGAWDALSTKKEKEKLLLVLIFLCFIPSCINVSVSFFQDYWTMIYPLAYYLIGAYLKEYGLNMKKYRKVFVLVISSALHFFAAVTFFKENMWSINNGHNNFFVMINTIMVFSLLMDINTDNFKEDTKRVLAKMADAVLATYMFSFITDIFVYRVYAMNFIRSFEMRLLFSFPLLVMAATISICFGMLITKITNTLVKRIIGTTNRHTDVNGSEE